VAVPGTCDVGGACEPDAGADGGLVCVEQYATNGTSCGAGGIPASDAGDEGGGDAGEGGAGDGGQAGDDGGALDATLPPADGSTPLADASSPEASATGAADASEDGAAAAPSGASASGCSCRQAPAESPSGPAGLMGAWVLAALLRLRRARREA
jgi:MYXO-CTERM domain-containing protein